MWRFQYLETGSTLRYGGRQREGAGLGGQGGLGRGAGFEGEKWRGWGD